MERIVYALYHPVKSVPVYVGKTINGIDRPWKHITEKSHSNKVNDWVKELKEHSMQPVIVVLDRADDDVTLDKKETFWINSFINDGFALLNHHLINPAYFSLSYYKGDDYLSEVRVFIKRKRKENNLTQLDLANKAGVGLRLIRDIEQGKKTNFNTDVLQKIISLFGCRLTVSNN